MLKFSPKSPNRDEPPPEPTRDEVIAGLKKVLDYAVYEESDYEITEEYVRIDLAYDSKGTVDSYQGRLKDKYPGRVTTDGTITTIYFKARRTDGVRQHP